MSEPSPEAKQAAGNWFMEGNSNVAAHMAYAIGYDAATAKLREVNQALVDNAKTSARIHIEEKKALECDLKDADKVIAKLREELENQRTLRIKAELLAGSYAKQLEFRPPVLLEKKVNETNKQEEGTK